MRKESIKKSTVITYLVCFFAVFISARAEIFGIRPFVFAVASVAIFLELNPLMVAAALLASSLPDWNIYVTLYMLYGGVILFICGLIKRKIGKMKPYFVFIPAIVASAGQFAYMITSHYGIFSLFLHVFLLLGFTSVCYCFAIPTLEKQFKYAFVQHEVISGYIFLSVISCGLACFAIKYFNPLLLFFGLYLPFSYKVLGKKNTLISAICMGIGSALGNNDVTMIAAFAFTAIMVMIFATTSRFFMPPVALIAYTAFVLYFDVEYSTLLYSLAAMAAGGVIFLLIPKKLLELIASYLSNDFDRAALRYLVNQSRYEIGNSLAALGTIFCEMGAVMRSGGHKTQTKISEVVEYVRSQACLSCAKYPDCKRIPAMNRGLGELCQTSLERGKAGVGDLPTPITQNCCNIAKVIAATADASDRISRQNSRMEVENKAKEIVADQLVGVSSILSDMGKQTSLPFSYDTDLEKHIIDELMYIGVVCSEALVTGTDAPENITLVVLTDTEINSEKLEQCIGKCVGKKLKMVKCEDSILSGWSIIDLKPAPKYDALFGYSGKVKDGSEVSGDTHSFIKLTHDKFMMALCDGMGSGSAAHDFSVTTISLIESFYKAGFNHELVLENVNKFLSIGNGDIFSAVDVCIVDLDSGAVDIIKIGSPSGYIKTSDSLVKISGEALPMGMLDELKPTARTMGMVSGDIMIVMSDGVSDSFIDGTLDDFVNNLPEMNPGELCSAIISKAVEKSGGKARDDMSVAAFKLFYS